MLKILKTTPGVKAPTLGISNDPEGTYLQYVYPNQYGDDVIVHFVVRKSEDFIIGNPQETKKHPYTFLTDLPGLSPPEGPPPSHLGTDKIVPKWQSQCDASVMVAID
jgi:hypothetical protein